MIWLFDFLSSQGLNTETLAKKNNIGAAQLQDPDSAVTAEQHQGVLRDAQLASKDSALGLRIGLHRSMATLDQLAYLMMSSATLRESSTVGLRYQNYSGRFSGGQIVTSFSELKGEGCYQIQAQASLGELRLLAVEDILANIVTTCRWVLGKNLPITRLRCDYPAPPHAALYETIFNCPIQFDSAATQLFFDASILDQALPQASPRSAALYEAMCERKSISRNQGAVAWRVWQMIVDNPADPLRFDQVAEKLNSSSRTLSRKLLEQGWTYQQLLDQVREIHARRYLSDPTLSVTQIAHSLGYADSSGFQRAFKKWTGHSPKRYRNAIFG
ncbi:AraC family transcriptional regulator [Seongchinamella unica]|uniref:AraC family transcriptional regulator n=1 Tax=Seongchinamella unica TaxID=2547392 RepID=A0A4R5LMP2_9GAMM|nr:AraC family transcriptional regulator [Seongchinamella unica]TDG11268.1 AraC family transcriptional regulator [Seongchinamella unica]